MDPIAEDKKRPIESKPENTVETTKTVPNKKIKVVRRKYKAKEVDQTSPLGVLQFEIKEILEEFSLKNDDISNDLNLILNDKLAETQYHRVEDNVKVLRLLSNGDGLAVIPHPIKENGKQVCVIPFGLPGDVVKIKVFKLHPLYVESDLLEVVQSSEFRNDSLINCRYFGKCSGCQYQNVEYSQLLEFKKQTIQNAYKFLAPILSSSSKLPPVDDTEPSPLQYAYRTKLTPHFNLPYKKPADMPRPPLGFGSKGRPTWREGVEGGNSSILDIEECSIGTPIINQGMKNERQRFEKEYNRYKKGATILLREDTHKMNEENVTELTGSLDSEGNLSTIEIKKDSGTYLKTCVTQLRQIVTEYVNGNKFEFSAGEFFQNNNSILPAVLNYVSANLEIANSQPEDENYLVDAYCGSGLFSISCSKNVSRVIGVEVSADSVKFAERNAKTNNISNAKFIVGKAEQIFGSIDTPPERTSVILDPPRKGCDELFLNQLSDFHPAKIVYVSCNVHSQARDVDWFINKTKSGNDYYVKSIKGFDFFPQTHHVESVVVLALK